MSTPTVNWRKLVFSTRTVLAAACLIPGLLGGAQLLQGQDLRPASPSQASSSSQSGPENGYQASAYLPLEHWAYPILDYWIASGRVTSLSPFVKPYRRIDVARVVHELRERVPYGFEEEWLERLERELGHELRFLAGEEPSPDHLDLGVRVGGSYRTQLHRDPLRPELDGPFARGRFLEEAFATGEGQMGFAATGFRVGRHGIFRHDPQFPDGRVVPDKKFPVVDEGSIRVEEGYVELQSRYASLFFGRMYRNWGLPRQLGFTRSNYAYSEDELAYRLGIDRLQIIGSFATLPDFGGDTTRYLSTHRLEVRPWDRVVIAATEAAIHGGPNQPVVFSLITPLGLWHIARRDDDPPKNMVGQLDVWVRAMDGLTVYASLLADATLRTEKNDFCCQMGGTLGVEVSSARSGWILRGHATGIQSLTYRTPAPWEEWSLEGIGLGWDKTDLFLFTLEGEWFGRGGLILRPRLDLQILGEGDFREPRPEGEELIGWPDFLVGQAETTFRPGLGGRWQAADLPLDLEWDLGLNWIDAYGHQEGVSRTAFVGSVRLVWDAPLFRVAAPGRE